MITIDVLARLSDMIKNLINQASIDRLVTFKSIDLEEMNNAALMKRIDNKYLLNLNQLDSFLLGLNNSYSILKINETLNHSYSSIYYDTQDLKMYMEHHNKKANRYKIRKRIYNTSNDCFLEVKHKNNKGYTKKTRVEIDNFSTIIPTDRYDFIQTHTPFRPFNLRKTLKIDFYRFTLTNSKRNQRITIDTNLVFTYENAIHRMDNLVIAEIKSDRYSIDKTIFGVLKDLGIQSNGMSKYSIGLALMRQDLKQNLFKQKIHTLNKICYGNR